MSARLPPYREACSCCQVKARFAHAKCSDNSQVRSRDTIQVYYSKATVACDTGGSVRVKASPPRVVPPPANTNEQGHATCTLQNHRQPKHTTPCSHYRQLQVQDTLHTMLEAYTQLPKHQQGELRCAAKLGPAHQNQPLSAATESICCGLSRPAHTADSTHKQE